MIPTPSDVRNEDWTKARTWDIWLGYRLVSTLEELKEYCDRQQISLDHFLSLPAAEAMPEGLKEEAALYRQGRMAERMGEEGEEKGDAGEGGDAVRGVVGRVEEVMEKGLLRRVRSRRGAERYDQPIGSVIKPDVIPGRPSIRPDTPSTSSAAKKPTARPGRKGGHYGTFSLDDYLDGLSEGEFPSWTTAYKAAWLDSSGDFDAVADHDAIPGGREGAFTDGKVRVAIAGYKGGQGNVHYQVRGKANKTQAATMVRLMEELGGTDTKVNVTGNDRGEDEPVNGEFTFSTPTELRAFLRDPTKRPEKREGGSAARERAAFLAQFKEEDAIEVKEDADLETTWWEALDIDLDTVAEVIEGKAVRRVRTPEGARRYNQPIGTVIRPGVPGGGVTGAVSRAVRASRPAPSRPAPSRPSRPGREYQAPGNKPTALLREREARLGTDSAYREAFEAQLAFIEQAVPRFDDDRPDRRNPEYAAYVQDLNRRLAHALVEPGPFGARRNGDGKWVLTPEGTRLAKRIVGQVLADADGRGVPSDRNRRPGERRKVIVAAGVSGAGKTSTLKRQGRELAGIEFDDRGVPTNFAVANADDMKEMVQADLPQAYADLGINPGETALLTHELSSSANKELIDQLIEGGYDIVLDGTFQGKMAKREWEIDKFEARDYEITAVLVDGLVTTSLERAVSRHIALGSVLRERGLTFADVDLGAEGEVDRFGIPDGGYPGRYVTASLIGEQVADGRRDDTTAPWDGEAWKSANAMNFQSSIERGMFDAWVVVDSGGRVMTQGRRGEEEEEGVKDDDVYRESTSGILKVEGKQEEEVRTGSAPTRDNMRARDKANARWLSAAEPGTYPLIEKAVDYADGVIGWDELVTFVEEWTPTPRKTLAELGWHDTEDAFPQPGTHDELTALGLADILGEDEYGTLDRILGGK